MGRARAVEAAAEADELEQVELEEIDDAEAEREEREEAKPSPLPRARLASSDFLPAETQEAAHISPLGGLPPTATHWKAYKRNVAGEFVPMQWGAPGSPVELSEWPLIELSIESLRERWGAGCFRVQWVAARPAGGHRILRGGREVTVRPVDAPAAPSSAPALDPFMAQMAPALQFFAMVEKSSSAKVTEMMQMAAAFGGAQRGNGLGPAELELIMRNNRDATTSAIAAAVAPLQAELTALRAAAAAEDDDDDEPSTALAGTALAAAAPLFKGKGTFEKVMNFAAAQPKLAEAFLEKGLPIISELGGKLLGVLTPPAPPKPRAAPPVAPLPPVEAAPAAPPRPGPPPGSLSAWAPAAASANGGMQ